VWVLLGWLVIAIGLTIGAVAAGQRTDPAFTWIDVATLPIAWFVPFVVIVTGLGVVADVRAGLDRARDRLGPSLAASRPAERTWSLALATANELVPGQSAATRATIEAERVRLAGDLHATVLPELRRAIDDAERGGDAELLARHLRSVDLELERLMADRWPIVLESFGLVAALEDLAERLEADGSPPISIDVERSDGRPPAPVERASWRFAQVALDNAVRHAAATTIDVRVAVDAAAVRLEVADDGRGLPPATAVRLGARGLADARRRADAIGASISIDSRPGGGTRVALDWTAPTRPGRDA
jgi:signal transduction histidine kinase